MGRLGEYNLGTNLLFYQKGSRSNGERMPSFFPYLRIFEYASRDRHGITS